MKSRYILITLYILKLQVFRELIYPDFPSFPLEERARVLRTLTAIIPKVEELRTRLLEHYTHKNCEEHINFFLFRRARVLRTLMEVIPKVKELRKRVLEHYTHKQCEEHINFNNTAYFDTAGVLENLFTILIFQDFHSKK
jgi:hypothetical protein